jgi:RHS repeat-associated protein
MATSAPTYGGFDAFNRVTNVVWSQDASDLVELEYGYDLASNRTFRQDGMATGFDELYQYDGLQRLKSLARGTLASINTRITSPKLQQGWELDATGNWSGFDSSDYVTAANSTAQRRTSNAANEIAAITTDVGTIWNTPLYDRNGNMNHVPDSASPSDNRLAGYDAWNRLVYYDPDESGNQSVTHYDGLNRRATHDIYNSSGTLLSKRSFLYSDQWQVLEERLAAAPTIPDRQFVWGLRYIDDLILRDRSNGGTLNERLYNLADANWNTVALYDPVTAPVILRANYTPYGLPSFLDVSFNPTTNTKSWETLYCGYRYEIATGLYLVRMRWMHAWLGCWLTSDPLGSLDTDNLYLYVRANPLRYTDPSGLTEYNDSLHRSNYYCSAAYDNPTTPWLRCACGVSYLICLGAAATSIPFTTSGKKAAWLYCIIKCIFSHWLAGYAVAHPESSLPKDSGLQLGNITIDWQNVADCFKRDGESSSRCCRLQVVAEQSALQSCMSECGKYDSTQWGKPFDHATFPQAAEYVRNRLKIGLEILPFEGEFNDLLDRTIYGVNVCCGGYPTCKPRQDQFNRPWPRNKGDAQFE